jgi:hypothetical protein
MAYQKTTWKDHVVQYPNRYTEVTAGGYVTETPAPGEIIQQGTPQSASNFNNNEEGTFAANEFGDFLMLQVLQLQRGVNNVTGESGTVVIPNTQTYPFNNSLVTIALATPRETTNYFVQIEVLSVTGGAAGDVTIANKLLNGFQISYNGSASSVTIHYNVTGGSI